jgi:hypothetical protein
MNASMLAPRIALAVLCCAGVPAGARAQTPAFDPRSWKDAVAGPPSEVLVLGTVHLGSLPHPLEAGALTPLLDRLAAFRPTVITVEALPGETCDVLARFQAVYPGTAERYCQSTEEARRATGLDVPAAETEIEKLLTAWPAQPTAAQRRRLAALFLAANDRASAAVQWLRLPQAERRAGDGIDAALLAQLTKVLASPKEDIQIGAALAARLGLERVHPVDDHLSDAVMYGVDDDGWKAIQDAWASSRSKLGEALDAQRRALRRRDQVLDLYRALNRPEALRDNALTDFGANLRHQSPQRDGRKYVAGWEARNLHMVANIRAAFAGQPGARVLVVVGAAHKAYFDAYLDLMHDVKLADVAAVLQ